MQSHHSRLEVIIESSYESLAPPRAFRLMGDRHAKASDTYTAILQHEPTCARLQAAYRARYVFGTCYADDDVRHFTRQPDTVTFSLHSVGNFYTTVP